MLKDVYLRNALRILVTMLILYMANKLSFLFTPVFSVAFLILAPVIIAGFFYYILRPLIHYMDKLHFRRMISVLLIYLFAAVAMAVFMIWIWPSLQEQAVSFAENAPDMIQNARVALEELRGHPFWAGVIPEQSDLLNRVSEFLDHFINLAINSISNWMTTITNIVLVVSTVPIVLYYMLKEGEKFRAGLRHLVPHHYRNDVQIMLHDIDKALGGFIMGRFIVTFLMSILIYVGFLIIDQPYPMLMTLISAIFNFIPYFGPIISTIPIVIVAFIDSPMTALWSLIIIIVAQQIESNVFSPVVYGKSMDLHPLSAVLVSIAGVKVGGFWGLLLAIPVYMVVKVMLRRAYSVLMLKRLE